MWKKMKIYSFWSGDTTYFTKYKSLKKAQTVGKENMKHYFDTCKELEEKPTADERYFIPNEVELVEKSWFDYMVNNDPDILILNDVLYQV